MIELSYLSNRLDFAELYAHMIEYLRSLCFSLVVEQNLGQRKQHDNEMPTEVSIVYKLSKHVLFHRN